MHIIYIIITYLITVFLEMLTKLCNFVFCLLQRFDQTMAINGIKIINYNNIHHNTMYNTVHIYACIYSNFFTYYYEPILKKVIP